MGNAPAQREGRVEPTEHAEGGPGGEEILVRSETIRVAPFLLPGVRVGAGVEDAFDQANLRQGQILDGRAEKESDEAHHHSDDHGEHPAPERRASVAPDTPRGVVVPFLGVVSKACVVHPVVVERLVGIVVARHLLELHQRLA